MSDSAKYLRSLATHFAPRDWNYTRTHDIKHIRYADDYRGYDHPWARIKRVFKDALFPRETIMGFPTTLSERVAYARVILETDAHIPDGVLNNGNVITHWEEDGEYLQMVQPSVGEMLADFLIAEPDHPHAVKILAELDRIRHGYRQRVEAEAT